MPLYLLDTNVLSNLSKPRPSPELVEWCNRLKPRDWCIAQCTVVEIKRGIKHLQGKGERRRGDALSGWFENLLASRPRIIPLDDNIIDIFTDLSLVPALQGLVAPSPGKYPAKIGRDVEIAATAISMNAVVATMNVSDFVHINAHIRLPGLLNPETGEWIVRQKKRKADVDANVGHWDRHRRLGAKLMKYD